MHTLHIYVYAAYFAVMVRTVSFLNALTSIYLIILSMLADLIGAPLICNEVYTRMT